MKYHLGLQMGVHIDGSFIQDMVLLPSIFFPSYNHLFLYIQENVVRKAEFSHMYSYLQMGVEKFQHTFSPLLRPWPYCVKDFQSCLSEFLGLTFIEFFKLTASNSKRVPSRSTRVNSRIEYRSEVKLILISSYWDEI